jgi:hypothetical protein
VSTPAEQVRERLATSRARDEPFEEAWAAALDALLSPPPGARLATRTEHLQWRVALLAAEPAWRRAYGREPPTRAERAVERLAGAAS